MKPKLKNMERSALDSATVAKTNISSAGRG